MKQLKFLFTPAFMGVLFVLAAISMAVATFIENGLGSAAAYSIVYNAWWFELILLLLGVNLVGQVITMKLLRKEKLTIGMFHLAFILMLIGAAITRYFGWEASIHIREGEEQKECYTADKFLKYTVTDDKGALVTEHAIKYSVSSAEKFNRSFNVNNHKYKLILAKVIPNAMEGLTESPDGVPIVSMIVTRDMMEHETLIVRKGELKSSHGITVGFESGQPADVIITSDSGKFFISSKSGLGISGMMSREITSLSPGQKTEFKPMQILTVGEIKIVAQQLSAAGVVRAIAVKPEEQTTGTNALLFHLISDKSSSMVYLWDREGELTASVSLELDGNKADISYGVKLIDLPFTVRLNDFILERYPGSSSPSGYKSDVVIVDAKNNVNKPFSIFMNNILKYKGFRFYQSSFDKDEKGTILSVNHDMGGMLVTYTGYAILFIFIILSIANRNAVFHNMNPGHWNSLIRKGSMTVIVMLFLSVYGLNAQKLIPDRASANEFGKVLVQDQKGRTKPLFTLSNDILRKVSRTNEFEGLNSMQVFLGLYLDFDNWKDVPLIRISNAELQKQLGLTDKFAAFTDLVKLDTSGSGHYLISEEVNRAYSRPPSERTKTDKEIMKIDERLNIVYMLFKGDFLKLFPSQDSIHSWVSPNEALMKATTHQDSLFYSGVMPLLSDAFHTNNVVTVKQIVGSITGYQKKYAQYSLPANSKTSAELLYYKLGIFERLFPVYATLGFILLTGLIVMVIRGNKSSKVFTGLLSWLLFLAFLFHTFGLGLRWYIAGHSPMSNGYESMIFISWATLLAGFIFSRKSAFALSATAVLASMTLMVAHLSFMDPEITNLVPVLKSYWLTLHVSVITGSYGFLGLGAILGLIVLILIALSNDKNRDRISDTVDELTVINFKTLALGLYFLTIGTFLGAVWANESWGRYWGWDPKETWSLITIIIYSIVVHSRRIPGMKDVFTFNLVSLFAFSSVLMTYFGVNYYLSGMHSYAAGEAATVPSYVYITVIVLTVISFLAYSRYKLPGKEKKS